MRKAGVLLAAGLAAGCGDSVGVDDTNGLRITPESVSLTHPGDTVRLMALDAPGSLAWSTPDTDIVQVDEGGLVTAFGYGTTIVTARTSDAEASIPLSVLGNTSLAELAGTWSTEDIGSPEGLEPEGRLWLRKDQGALRGVWRGRRNGNPVEVVTLAMQTGSGWTMARADGVRGTFALMGGKIAPGRVELDSGTRMGTQIRERTILSDFTMQEFLWTVEESVDGGTSWTSVWTHRVTRTEQQTPPAPLDTLSEACVAPEYAQFDFWLGDWTVTVPSGGTAGSNRIHRIAGCGIQENWRDAGTGGGVSLNMYDPRSQLWTQFYVASAGGWLEISGSFRSGRMVLETPGDAVQDRVSWRLLDDGRVRQLWRRLAPGGGFSTAFEGFYSSR